VSVAFVTRPVTVEVPATSANLGPGFDCLGLALELGDTLVAEVAPSGIEVVVEGEGAGEVPLDERHLVVRSMQAAFAVLGDQPPGLRLTTTNRIPHGRGMGSSSAAIVGGIVLARALVEDGPERLPDPVALALAVEIEGHADNVGPALLGGLVICGHDGDDAWAEPAPLDPDLAAVVFVPPDGVLTEVARSLLPESVPFADAVANSGRVALLVRALGGRPDLLLRATEDFLHQEHRGPAMPESLGLVASLRERGVAAVVSGAGPSVLALTTSYDVQAALLDAAPPGWRAIAQRPGGDGARVLP
jgi:homoserine kinase